MNETLKKLSHYQETPNIDPALLRQVKKITKLLSHLASTNDEADFFESSAEVMRLCALVIKQSHFATAEQELPYGEQALEFSIDRLLEQLEEEKIISYDN